MLRSGRILHTATLELSNREVLNTTIEIENREYVTTSVTQLTDGLSLLPVLIIVVKPTTGSL